MSEVQVPYPYTDVVEPPAAISEISVECAGVRAGALAGGLLALTQRGDARNLSEEYGVKHPCIAYSGFGDLFVVDAKGAILLVSIQARRVSYIGASLRWFLESFMDHPDVRRSILREALFTRLRDRDGDLPYGTIFTQVPMLALGGDDRAEHYRRGHLGVYLSIVSQTLDQCEIDWHVVDAEGA